MNTRMIPRSLSMLSSRLFAHPRLLSRTTQNLVVPFVLSKRNFLTTNNNNNANDKEMLEEIKKLSPFSYEEKQPSLGGKYKGISESPFSNEITCTLLQPVNPYDIEVRADGMIYLPEIKYRRILLQAFGPGGWSLRQTSDFAVIDGNLCASYALYCNGRYVAEAVGEQQLTSAMTLPTSIESAKSNALVRCCKDLGIASELWDPHFINDWKSQNRITESVNGKILYKKKPLNQIDSNPQPKSTPHLDLKNPLKPIINITPNANPSPNSNSNANANTNASPSRNASTNPNFNSTPNQPNINTSSNTNTSPSPNANPKPSPSPNQSQSQSQSQSQKASVNSKPNTTTNANANHLNEMQSKSSQNTQNGQSGANRLSPLFKPPSQSETQTQQTPQNQKTETQPKPTTTASQSQSSQAPPSPRLSNLLRETTEIQPNTTAQNTTEQTTEKPVKIENNPPKPTTTTTTPNQPPQKTIPPFLNKENVIEPTSSHKPTTSQKSSERPEKPEPNPLNDDGDDVFQSPFRAAPTSSSTSTQKTETFNFELMLDQKVPPEYKKVAHLTWGHVFNETQHVRYLIWAAGSMKSEHLQSLAKQALEFLRKNPTRFPTASLAQ